jgi:hypothetical protein
LERCASGRLYRYGTRPMTKVGGDRVGTKEIVVG